MKTGLTVDGFDEMDRRINDLAAIADPDRLRALGIDALEPVAETARSLVRARTGRLRNSIMVGDQLSPAQAAQAHTDPGSVEIYVGPGSMPQAITEEFGTMREAPHPYLRPAWDGQVDEVLKRVASALGEDFTKAGTKG